MLHELLHWAGEDHLDNTGNGGPDGIYACSRYCTRCSDLPVPGSSYINPADSAAEDCAACSEGLEAKLACGTRETYPTSSECANLCFDLQSDSAVPATSCDYVLDQFCGGTTFNSGLPGLCGITCPPGDTWVGPHTPDCPGADRDTCQQLPPACQP
jgi:hypothetical protein